jgi:hypothetical protein
MVFSFGLKQANKRFEGNRKVHEFLSVLMNSTYRANERNMNRRNTDALGTSIETV